MGLTLIPSLVSSQETRTLQASSIESEQPPLYIKQSMKRGLPIRRGRMGNDSRTSGHPCTHSMHMSIYLPCRYLPTYPTSIDVMGDSAQHWACRAENASLQLRLTGSTGPWDEQTRDSDRQMKRWTLGVCTTRHRKIYSRATRTRTRTLSLGLDCEMNVSRKRSADEGEDFWRDSLRAPLGLKGRLPRRPSPNVPGGNVVRRGFMLISNFPHD